MLSELANPKLGSSEIGSHSANSGDVPAVFVTYANSLSEARGGLQICTQEYLQTIRAAGFAPSVQEFEHDRGLATRIAQRLAKPVYGRQWRPELVDDIVSTANKNEARFIFLNLVNLAPLVHPLRARLASGAKIVLLSHGLESVDYIHTVAARELNAMPRARDASRLGQQFFAEYDQRRAIDHVFCLSPFEAEIERWLGAKRVTWLPRTIAKRSPLKWRPNRHRIGFVGTLDHPPNKEGLVSFLKALETKEDHELELRLIGGPPSEGRALGARFRMVRYLGALNDEELESEASTWSCFVHPLFCFARGCSTKLAVALGWQIPIATTPAGCRGYMWRNGSLPLADGPEELARLTVHLTEAEAGMAARDEIKAVVESSPGIPEVAHLFRNALELGTE